MNNPHGGKLVNLIVEPERAKDLQKISRDLQSITLSGRQMSDLELLMNGAFSPLRGFMTSADYNSVRDSMRLQDGTLWPIPVCLDINEQQSEALKPGQLVALRDSEGFMVAVLAVEDIWAVDKSLEAYQVYGTRDIAHPGVDHLLNQVGTHYIGGAVQGIQYPLHFAFRRLRHTPAEMLALYKKLGWRRIVGFHTRNPLHRAQFEMTLRAMAQARANLLLHPVVTRVKPGDIDVYTRIRCYLQITNKYPPNMMQLSLLPLSMRMAGPKEALLHTIIRKNYGCTHFIIGRNHASPGSRTDGHSFYERDASIRLVQSYSEELGITIVPFDEMVYVMEEDTHMPASEAPPNEKTLSLSDDDFHSKLRTSKRIPEWFTFPEVIEVLRQAYPPRHKQGVTIFCTGLSGAGKSTIARVVYSRFLEMGGRPVTLLDGDIVRNNLSNELGFSREHRDINVRRIGFVASEITKNRGIAICAPIAPYKDTRRQIRQLIENYGGFVEVHVATPVEVCEGRDRKGLYAKARAGMIKGFTGIDDPYESPETPEVFIDTSDMTPDEAAQEVLLFLERAGYIK
ncbi:MAG: bifunctional sulfate adenylyltransferase/adenylylsulfate kinase [Desulfobacteraceae bacterium]|nr:bifunctional sulfate adenylyltransferase/adenylylsulfate kinase [Desulfobacteraceae bacterium]